MQEEIENRTVNLAISTTRLTANTLIAGFKKYMQHRANVKARNANEKPVGKQSIKELIGQNQGVSSIDIAKTDIRGFEKYARSYGVDYAIVKDKTQYPPQFTLSFKAKDADAITQVLKEYTAKQMKKQQRQMKPSILEKLKKFKDIVAKTPRKEKEKRKEQTR